MSQMLPVPPDESPRDPKSVLAGLEKCGVALVPVEPSEAACGAAAARAGVSIETVRTVYRAMIEIA